MTTPRKYKGSDAEMLLTASTIIASAIANKDILVAKRPAWAGTFFNTLKADIDQAFRDHLGVDNARDLRDATRIVHSVFSKAATLLAEFKVQVTEDFRQDKPRRDEILNRLGLTTYLKGVQRGDQEALISLLYQFATNMDANLEAQIVAKGLDPAAITAIAGYAQQLKDANVNQEGFKGSRKNTTEAGVTALNSLYERTIGIAKIAAKLLKEEPAKAQQFSFTKVKAALNSSAASAKGNKG